jgi:hypothetical protein
MAGVGDTRAVSAEVIALSDCVGRPLVRPRTVIFTCADASFLADHLRWTGWGGAFAASRGIARVNDCTPSCVAGHSHSYPIVLLASGRQRCRNGQPAYLKVTYAFIGRSPFPVDAPGTRDPTVTYRCR